MVESTEPPMEDLQNLDQTDSDYSKDFDLCFVRVTIHSLSLRSTILEELDDS